MSANILSASSVMGSVLVGVFFTRDAKRAQLLNSHSCLGTV
jgi:hypothetical protein